MRLLIIRHGESEADRMDVYEGRADFPLTDRGMEQAEALADWLKARYIIDEIVTSPLRRARQTADAIARVYGIEPIEDERLMEFDNGRIAGLARAEANKKYPVDPNLPPHRANYGMESQLAFRFRAEEMLSALLTEHPLHTEGSLAHGSHGASGVKNAASARGANDLLAASATLGAASVSGAASSGAPETLGAAADATIAVVSHGGLINQLYRAFLRMPMDARVSFPTGDTGVHAWRAENDQRIVEFANRQEHILTL